MNAPATPVLAGVDGSAAGLQAVRWAARAAVRYGAPLRLVHAVPSITPNPYPTASLYIEELRVATLQDGARFLDEARAAAAEVDGDLVVTVVQRAGDPTQILSLESASARLVVLGATGRNGLADLLIGSTALELPSRSHTPVVVVRERPDGTVSDSGPVVLGVAGSVLDEAPVAFAFAQASLLGAELIAVHAWSDSPLPDIDRITGRHDDWKVIFERERRLLSEGLAGYAERYPDVAIRHVVVYDRPARSLLDYADNAQLLVVGTRGRGILTATVLGSTSRAAIKLARCPVAVVRRYS